MASPFYFESTTYWSDGDERAHFEWLERIPAIRSVRGEGLRVYLEIDQSIVGGNDLRELEAVYRRFGGDLGQLARLKERTVT